MPASLKLRLAQISVLLIFLALGFRHSLLAPLADGPDEVAHFYFTRFIARHGRLPIDEAERAEAGYKSDWPPLFHLLVGLAGRGIDLDRPPFIKVAQNNPRLQLVVGHENIVAWRALTTEDPYQSEVLLWYLGRWITLLSGLAGLAAAYLLIHAAYPDRPWLALGAAGLLAFLPTYALISGVISYEPLLGALLAFYFVFLFYIVRYPDQNWPYGGAGLLMGLAALTKYTPWPALPVLPLLVIWLGYRRRWPWPTTLARLALVSLGLVLTIGSWLFYMGFYFNRISELGWGQGLLSPFLVTDGSDTASLRLAALMTEGKLGVLGSTYHDSFAAWSWRLVSQMWGGGWLAWLFLGLWAIALAGLIRQWRQTPAQKRLWLLLLGLHAGLFTILPWLRFLLTRQAASVMGQHLLLPAGAALVLLLVYGLNGWFNIRLLTGLVGIVAAACLGQTTLSILQPNYSPPWPIQTVPLPQGEPILARFDPFTLIGYEYATDDHTLKVTLRWRTEAQPNEDYRTELTLLDAVGHPQVRWPGQPLNGRYPTRAWSPGDRVRDVIYLPIAGLPQGNYQLQLRVLGESGVISTGASEALSLGQVPLSPSPPPEAGTLLLGEQKIAYTFWPQPHPAKTMPLYGENAIVTFSTGQRFGDEVQLKLVGPDEQSHSPVDHTGYVYNFKIDPGFASGDYRLRAERVERVEQGAEGELAGPAESPPLFRVKTEARQFQVGPIAHPISANFAGYVALLGYDLPRRRVEPGGQLPLTLHWQALRTIGANLIIFNHLIDAEQRVWGGRDRVTREVYSTMLWAPGEAVSDPFSLQVAPDAPNGIYYLLVGLYLPVGEAPVSLPLLENGQFSQDTSVKLGPIKVGQTPPGLTIPAAAPQVWLNRLLGDASNLALLGYDLARQTDPLAPGVNLILYWRAESSLDTDYTTFVHLRDAAGQIVAQQDQAPLKGAYPTSLWEPGEIIADKIMVPLPPEIAPGEYQFVVGMYDFQTDRRLTVPGEAANEIMLTGFEVAASNF